jgi:mono/diheme cytochrome c family protein
MKCMTRFMTEFAVFVAISSSMLISNSFAQTSPAKSGNGAEAESTFRTKCSGCHGPNGAGDTDIGRTLKVPDLRGADVKKQTRAQLIDAITNGKNSRMPAFKSTLNPDQVRKLVQYIRQLPKSEQSAR